MNRRGYTLLEVVIAGTLLAILMGAAAVAVSTDTRTHRVLVAQTGAEMRAQKALDRIVAELRTAGEWGEDRDHDGVLDDGEDTNGNGVLDANWNLPDGINDANTISLNRRIDDMVAGEIVASGIYSRRITYRLDKTSLVREWDRTGPGGKTRTLVAVMAEGVTGLRFSRKGPLVTVEVDVRVPEDVYVKGKRTYSSRVWLRN